MKNIVTPRDLACVNSMLDELICLQRWSELVASIGRFSELGKQALNCAIAYFLAVEAKHQGHKVNFTLFPKIALVRSFTKTYQCDVPQTNLETIFQLGKVSKSSFDEMIWNNIQKSTSETFCKHLHVNPNCLESRIYVAARSVANYLELNAIKSVIPQKDYDMKAKQLEDAMSSFGDIPGFSEIFSENFLRILENYSQLRNRIRWAKHPSLVHCSVLGHHFDVAVFAYLMSLEKNPHDEELATRFFFMGIFHDFPERWTGDMPSPIKDSLPGLRKATEEFEDMVMEEHVYSKLPPHQVLALRQVMLEDSENTSFKKFLKKSDYFAAYVECWREIDAGSHHKYFLNVIHRDFKKKEELPMNFRLLAEKLYDDVVARY